jgi:hypothetical protein
MSSAAPALSEKTQKLVDQWLSWDKNPKNREEIQTLAQKGDEVELNKILGKRIAFGTAGSSNLPSRKRRSPLLSVRFAPPSMFGTIQTQPFMSHMVGESFLVSGSFVFCGLPKLGFGFVSVFCRFASAEKNRVADVLLPPNRSPWRHARRIRQYE